MNQFSEIDQIYLQFSPKKRISTRPQILSSYDAYKILNANWSNQISLLEEFNILLLDTQNHVLGMSTVSKGGLNSTSVDIRIAFATALTSKACAMILSHNHPSGKTQPSREDISLTKKFVEAGKLINITIHDHIILSPEDTYYSFADEGLIAL